MARPERPPQELLKRVEAALKAAKPKDVLSALPMADLLGMSWRNLLDTYIKPDPAFPLLQRGSQGRDYQFQVVKVLRHLRRKLLDRIKADNAKAANIAKLTNLELPTPEQGGPQSYDEVRQAIGAHREIERLKGEQGLYVPAAQVQTVIETIFGAVAKTLNDAGPTLDPIGQMDPAHRASLDKILMDLLSDIGGKVEAALKDLHGSDTAQRGGNVHRTGRPGS